MSRSTRSTTYDSIEAIQADLEIKRPQYLLSAEPTSSKVPQQPTAARATTASYLTQLSTARTVGVHPRNPIYMAYSTPHCSKGIGMNNFTAMQAAVTLLYPTCANPGHFLPDEQWSITRLQIATLAHDRDIANYNFKTRLIQAIYLQQAQAGHSEWYQYP